MSYDPLSGTPSSPTRSSPILPDLSPLAPRSPLPGQPNGHYRPQPLPPPPTNSHWNSPPPSATNSQFSRGSSSGGMTPRSPQGYPEQGRRVERDEEGGAKPVGEARPPPPDGFVRIKIMALEKNNRRDYYVKFNAEVRPSLLSFPMRTDEVRRATSPLSANQPTAASRAPTPSSSGSQKLSQATTPSLSSLRSRWRRLRQRRRRRMTDSSRARSSAGWRGSRVTLR